MPSRVKVLLPEHPIARGLPSEFTIEQTEMYNEPFHVPPPDAVVRKVTWRDNPWFPTVLEAERQHCRPQI